MADISPQRPWAESALEDPAVLERIRKGRLPINHIAVSPDLRGAHSQVRKAKKLLETGEVDPDGRVVGEEPKPAIISQRVRKLIIRFCGRLFR